MNKILVLIGLLLGLSAQASDLKILSWNIYLVPWPIHRSLQNERAQIIGTDLAKSDYDVILFQEVFSKEYHDLIWSGLKGSFPYETELFKNSGFFTLAGSGLWVVSKTPVKYLEHIFFDKCSGTDCFASKGAQLVEVQVKGQAVQFLNTHVQAWSGDKNDLIRISQFTQMRHLLEKHKREGVAQVIVGDMNTNYRDKLRVGQLLATLRARSAAMYGTFKYSMDPTNSWRPEGNSNLLDYILTTTDSPAEVLQKKLVRRETVIHNKMVDLSDHFGIEGVIRLNPGK